MLALPSMLPPRRHLLGALAALAALASIAIAVTAVVPSARAVDDQQARVALGSAALYSALASTVVTNDGASVYPQNVGVSPGVTLTGMEKAASHGELHPGDDAAKQAHADLVAAYNATVLLTSTADIAGDLGGRTITPGVYHAGAALAMTTTLTFDALGNPNAVFIFQIGAALNTTAGTRMVLVNGAQASNIFWQVQGAATLGGTSSFVGTIIGNAAITIGADSYVTGRALTINGAVTATNTKFGSPGPVPGPVADSATTGQGVPVTLNVLANDGLPTSGVQFSRAELSANPQLIGGASGPTPAAPTVGGVSCTQSGDCTYQSPASFVGTDGFDYAVSYSGQAWNVHVTITVTVLDQAPVLRSDRLVATTGGPAVSIMPLANDSDSVWDAASTSLTISGVSALPDGEGTISCAKTTCTYQPPTTGFTGTATVSYTTESQTAPPPATTTITIFVDPVPLQSTGFTDTTSSAVSAPVGTWTSSTPMPAAVTTCSSGRPVATVSWGTVAGATTWLVERRYTATSPGLWVKVASLPAASNGFVDALLGEGNNYQWRVRPDMQRWTGVFSSASVSTTASPAVSVGGC